MLRQAAPLGVEAIDRVTAQLRREYPFAFHNEGSLHERDFDCEIPRGLFRLRLEVLPSFRGAIQD